MLKNYQKLEFNLGHLGTGGKLYFHEYLPKKIQKIQTPRDSSIFCVSHPHCKVYLQNHAFYAVFGRFLKYRTLFYDSSVKTQL